MKTATTNVSYRSLVSALLKRKAYPVLHNFVVVDIYFTLLHPGSSPSETVRRFDRRFDDPASVYERENDPFLFSYVVTPPETVFDLHTFRDPLEEIERTTVSECIRVKLSRHVVDRWLETKSQSLEEEIYLFLTRLNFDVPSIRRLLDLDFSTSTRFIPLYVVTWVYNYQIVPIPGHAIVGPNARRYFGPTRDEGIVPVRFVRGMLSPCTSTRKLLSLRDDIAAASNLPAVTKKIPYLMHYSETWNAVIPLAYNPLENPII